MNGTLFGLELRPEMNVDVFEKHNGLLDNLLVRESHNLPQVVETDQVEIVGEKVASLLHQPIVLEIDVFEKAIEAFDARVGEQFGI